MLDFETIKFIDTASQYEADVRSKIIIWGVIALITAFFAFAFKNRGKLDNFVSIFLVVFMGSTFMAVRSNGVYCKAIVEAKPTKEITSEEMLKNENFEKIGDKIFFKCDIERSFLEDEKIFKDKNRLIHKVQKKFDSIENDLWIEKRTGK